jgi:hypothetical protein
VLAKGCLVEGQVLLTEAAKVVDQVGGLVLFVAVEGLEELEDALNQNKTHWQSNYMGVEPRNTLMSPNVFQCKSLSLVESGG